MPIRQIIADVVWPEGAERRNRAEREANTDFKTEVGNDRALKLARETAEADPDTAILFIDGNDFGLVNKIASHEAGDSLIMQTARVISNFALRVFRYGLGDEFVAFVPLEFAETTRRAIEDGFGVVIYHRLQITISCGIGNTIEEAEADMKLQKAERKQIWNNQPEAMNYRSVQETKRRSSQRTSAQLGEISY